MTTSKIIVNPTDDKDREVFAECVEYWRVKLGMTDWRIHVSPKHAVAAMADVDVDYIARLARVRLGKSFGLEPVTPDSLNQTALHEVLHVFLKGYAEVVTSTKNSKLIESDEHRIIHILENLLIQIKE